MDTEQRKALEQGIWSLVKDALAYGQMKHFGSYRDTNGVWCRVCHSDRANQEKYYLERLAESAEWIVRQASVLDPNLVEVSLATSTSIPKENK